VKKKYLVFGLLAVSSLYGFGQKTDSTYRKKKIPGATIQLVYSHYLQDGNHSAVTGGTGTEQLTVYSPDITWRKEVDSFLSYSVNTGVDIISSASTDNIDFVVSSASQVDTRSYLNVQVTRSSKDKRTTVGSSGYFSIESDYLSGGFGISASRISKDKATEFSAGVEAFFDDLRWGRLSGQEDLKLVYPAELRIKEWFDNYRRWSYNVNLGLHQTINRKMALAIFPGISYQHGLLSTPFHRVYFKDSSARVENLPAKRFKIPVGIQLNSFIGDQYILRSYYRYYWDDFGVIAHTLEAALAVKLSPAVVIAPGVRFYTQRSSFYFKPYQQHALTEKFYTSDYDLSNFQSYEGSVEIKLNSAVKRAALLNKSGLRYAFYKRTDGLSAHTLTLLLEFVVGNKRR
jgi:hypothetical protein